MNHATHFALLRRPLAVWLALLIAVLGAIAPTLSHGLVRTGDVPLVEICTSLGPRWVALTDAPDSPDGQESALQIEHCPFCLHASDSVAPPPNVRLHDFSVLGEPVVPTLGQAFLFIAQTALVPPPRGPPWRIAI
jgi:hypothetical protein